MGAGAIYSVIVQSLFWQIDFILDVQERADLRSADGTLVGLHSDNLTAIDTEAHVSARQHDGILRSSIAYNAFLLTLIRQISRTVIDSIDVVEVHDLVVVEQLLLLVFVSKRVVLSSSIGRVFRLVYHAPALSRCVLLKVSISKLTILLSSTSIVLWVDRLDLDDYGAEVALWGVEVEVGRDQLWFQLVNIDDKDLTRELLIQSRAEPECARCWHLRVTIEVQRNVASISTLHGAKIHSDNTLIVCIKLHL